MLAAAALTLARPLPYLMEADRRIVSHSKLQETFGSSLLTLVRSGLPERRQACPDHSNQASSTTALAIALGAHSPRRAADEGGMLCCS